MDLEIQTLELPPIGTNCYIVIDREAARAAVIDAPLNAYASVEKRMATEGWSIECLLLTHGHWDHTLDGWRFAEAGVPVAAHAADRILLETPEVMAPYAMPSLQMRPVPVQRWLEHGAEIQVLGRTVEVRHVPGHCPGSLLFWFKADEVAFCGDVIFCGGVGRTDFPDCSFESLEASIRSHVYTLPPQTRLLPGHGPDTTVADERRQNPFVRG